MDDDDFFPPFGGAVPLKTRKAAATDTKPSPAIASVVHSVPKKENATPLRTQPRHPPQAVKPSGAPLPTEVPHVHADPFKPKTNPVKKSTEASPIPPHEKKHPSEPPVAVREVTQQPEGTALSENLRDKNFDFDYPGAMGMDLGYFGLENDYLIPSATDTVPENTFIAPIKQQVEDSKISMQDVKPAMGTDSVSMAPPPPPIVEGMFPSKPNVVAAAPKSVAPAFVGKKKGVVPKRSTSFEEELEFRSTPSERDSKEGNEESNVFDSLVDPFEVEESGNKERPEVQSFALKQPLGRPRYLPPVEQTVQVNEKSVLSPEVIQSTVPASVVEAEVVQEEEGEAIKGDEASDGGEDEGVMEQEAAKREEGGLENEDDRGDGFTSGMHLPEGTDEGLLWPIEVSLEVGDGEGVMEAFMGEVKAPPLFQVEDLEGEQEAFRTAHGIVGDDAVHSAGDSVALQEGFNEAALFATDLVEPLGYAWNFSIGTVKRILLSIKMPEEEQCTSLAQFMNSASPESLKASVHEILDFVALNPYKQAVCLFALKTALSCHPEAFIDTFKPNNVPQLFHLDGNDDMAGDFLRSFLAFKEKYAPKVQGKAYSCRAEADTLLALCKRRDGVTDVSKLASSRLRDWLCSIWSHVRMSKPPPHALCTLILSWVDNLGDSMELKESVLLLLQHERQIGYITDMLLLECLFNRINASEALCSSHLQYVVFFFEPVTLLQLFQKFFRLFHFTESLFLSQWISLLLFFSQNLGTPTYLANLAEKCDQTGRHWYFFIHHYLEAGRTMAFEVDATSIPHTQYEQGVRIMENCLRVTAALAVNPINAADGLGLMLYLLYDGPFPLATFERMDLVYAPMADYFDRCKCLWELSGSLDTQLNGALERLQTLCQSAVQKVREKKLIQTAPVDQKEMKRMLVHASVINKPIITANRFAHPMISQIYFPSTVVQQPTPYAMPIGMYPPTPLPSFQNINAPTQSGYTPTSYPPPMMNHQSLLGATASLFPSNHESHIAASLPIATATLPQSVKTATRKVGLQNLGNTCFLNSSVQALYLTDAFISRCLQFVAPRGLNNGMNQMNAKVLESLKKLFVQLLTTKLDSISPSKFLKTLPARFHSGKQQDASEFLRILYNELGSHEGSLLRDIFAGMTVQNVQCQKCGYTSKRKEVIHDFSFNVTPSRPSKEKRKRSSEELSIRGYFDAFTKQEKLTGDNKYSCSRCNKKQNAKIWNEIYSPPAHIMVTLNRFAWTNAENRKVSSYVRIDESLMVWGVEYKVYAVILHAGQTANSGHYYCIGRDSEGPEDAWVELNDSIVTPSSFHRIHDITVDTVSDDAPYIVFYRCTVAPPTPLINLQVENGIDM